MNDMPERNMLDVLDELRAIAQTGLNYTQDFYDLQRYHRIRELVSKEYANYSGLPSKEIKARFAKELGYITPKVGVQCALFNESGKILLEKRQDDGLWGLPSGWVEAGESPETAIRRELLEETNLVLEEIKIIGIYSRPAGQFNQPHSSVHILYLCSKWRGELKVSFESLALEFHDPGLITRWHKDHKLQVDEAMKQWSGLVMT